MISASTDVKGHTIFRSIVSDKLAIPISLHGETYDKQRNGRQYKDGETAVAQQRIPSVA
jgi:hypothetical protein